MKRIQYAFDNGHVALNLDASNMDTVIRESVRLMVDAKLIDQDLSADVIDALLQRERDASTAIGHATAIPHTYREGIEDPFVFFVRLARPVNLGARDGIPTQFVFFLMGPPGSASEHIDTLASVARLMSDEEFRFALGRAQSQRDLTRAFDRFTARTAPEQVVPEAVSEGLTFSGRLFGGLRNDIKRRTVHYASDFKDGLHPKCAGATLFLFFACLAPAVTFGGVMGVATDGQIGAVEMILASAVCGVVFALFSGQPLVILGGTGPLLVFTAILYKLCLDMELPFLSTYAWVGLWTAVIMLVLAATDASCLMRYFTRFTDEIFAALISIIFVYEAIKSLIHIFRDLDVKQHHDTALLSLLLALGTFYIAMSLSRFRKSVYLRPKIREFLADFGPAIALAAMTIVAVALHEVFLDVLPAPDKFGTTSGRPWAVDLWATPMWVRVAAIGPALLGSVLVFLDQNITARIVNSPDHKLNKGEAYHLDLAVVGVLLGVCSLFGLPWLVAATVRSINHVRSVATFEEVVSGNGQTRDRVIHVRENRVTGLMIHLLIALSLFLLPLLKSIPMAVLYGLFLFMGVVSMSGNQFFERMSLWLKDPALYPVTHYIRRVPLRIVHYFTALQMICLGVLWVVKSSALGILFPIFIAVLVPVRVLAGKYFSADHLAALDAEEEPDTEETHWT
ncbi:MAG: PTS sugar transporter subunit IIA [Planctomycetota bacterium]|jgi:mannitol/fructose-specific phosphotransferase system IIA component (Ntr-type)